MKILKVFLKGLSALIFTVSFTLSVQAQQNTQAQPESELQNRVRELESQLEAMKTQLETLKKAVEKNGSGEAKTSQAENSTAQTSAKTEEKQESKPKTQEPRTLGIDLGSARITPYGSIYFNLFANSGGTNNADVPLFAAPTNVSNLSASVRQTRLGLKIDGPTIWKAKSSGVVEVDFFGGFPAVGLGENFGVVRMRLAYGRLDWEKTSIEAGQDWALFAPNNPVSVAAAAIPQLAAAGNLWERLPQFRAERRFDNGRLVIQGAVLAPSTGDYPGSSVAFFLQPGAGAASRTPAFESRISFNDKNWFGTTKAGSIGVSAHYGRGKVPGLIANNRVDSFGVALDWNSPLHKRVSFSGEGFFGKNLAAFQGGIFQGYNLIYISLGPFSTIFGAKSIRTHGGWTQVGWNLPAFQDRVTIYSSIGIDDPRDADLIIPPMVVLLNDVRKRNLAYTFSLQYKLSAQFTWGLEYRQFETLYIINRKQTANHLNLGIVYGF